MRIGDYSTNTSKKSLKGQYDEEKGCERIVGHGHQSDSIGSVKNQTLFRAYEKNSIEWHGGKIKYKLEQDNNLLKNTILQGVEEYETPYNDIDITNFVKLANGTVFDVLNYQEGDEIDIIDTEKFGEINFSNELNKYTIARNKEFFEILDHTDGIEVKIYDGKIDSRSLIYVDATIDGKRRAEAITLASLCRLLGFKGDNYDNHFENFKNMHGFNVTKIVKSRKKIRRNNNVNMVKYNDVA